MEGRIVLLQIEGVWPQAKGCWQSPGSGRDKNWVVKCCIVVRMHCRKCVFRILLLCGHCRVYYTNQDGDVSR